MIGLASIAHSALVPELDNVSVRAPVSGPIVEEIKGYDGKVETCKCSQEYTDARLCAVPKGKWEQRRTNLVPPRIDYWSGAEIPCGYNVKTTGLNRWQLRAQPPCFTSDLLFLIISSMNLRSRSFSGSFLQVWRATNQFALFWCAVRSGGATNTAPLCAKRSRWPARLAVWDIPLTRNATVCRAIMQMKPSGLSAMLTVAIRTWMAVTQVRRAWVATFSRQETWITWRVHLSLPPEKRLKRGAI